MKDVQEVMTAAIKTRPVAAAESDSVTVVSVCGEEDRSLNVNAIIHLRCYIVIIIIIQSCVGFYFDGLMRKLLLLSDLKQT